MTLPIETERLILRRYNDSDVADVIAFASHPSVAAATPDFEATRAGVKAYIDLQNSYRLFEEGKCFDLAVELKSDGKVIGLLSLVLRSAHLAKIGYALGPEYRGRGLATEATKALLDYAFDVLQVHRVQADTDSANVSSWRLMERVGMKREARLREAVRGDDGWLDQLIYGVLADEWRLLADDAGC